MAKALFAAYILGKPWLYTMEKSAFIKKKGTTNFGRVFFIQYCLTVAEACSKKPLTSVSKRVPGVHGKRGLERGWQKRLAKGWRKVGEGLAKGWQRAGEGLAKV